MTNGGHVVRYKFAFRWCDDQVGLLFVEFLGHAYTYFRARLGG